MKKISLFLLICVFTFWFPSAYKRWTHAFRPAKCLVNWPYTPEWDIPPLSNEQEQEIISILNQPFSYLGKGAQSYVFLSQDQKYVFKLFRHNFCRMPFGQHLVRQTRKWLGARDKFYLPPHEIILKDCYSCKLAYSLAQKQTGLIYISLNPKATHLPQIQLKDRLGRSHEIDPSLYRFAIQRKAELLLPTFLAHRNQAEPLFASFVTLLHELADLGIVNLDRTLGRNYGFLDGRAIQIDIGNFQYCPERASTDLSHFENRMKKWLKKSKIAP